MVVRSNKSLNLQQNPESMNDVQNGHHLEKGNIIKLGRLKFCVKDFRTDIQPANCDLKRRGMLERSASPRKRFYKNRRFSDESREEEEFSDDDSDELNAEEVVEIDCGVINSDEQLSSSERQI